MASLDLLPRSFESAYRTAYLATSVPLGWPMPAELLSSPAVEYRNRFAIDLAQRPVPQILQSYVYMSSSRMDGLLRVARRRLGIDEFRGTGLELGAGCGLLSSVAARGRCVNRIYSVEVCIEMVRRVIPKVSAAILGRQAEKVVPVWGSFDHLGLADTSVDFIIENDSLHHSDDLGATCTEAARVLKPGGVMLCFDRCHPDTLPDAEVERMLSHVYSKSFLRANCYPEDVVLTRRENGEHEYRLFEWRSAFAQAGLELAAVRCFFDDVRPALALKGILSRLPVSVRGWLYRSDNADFRTTLRWLKHQIGQPEVRDAIGPVNWAPKNTTVFLLRKAS